MKQISFRQVKHHWKIYFLALPAVLIVALFSYFPAASAMYHAFFRWDGDDISVYTALDNVRRAVDDEVLLASFGTVMILIAANLFKMVPSIVTAVVIHRLASDKWRYIYRVAFVIPMVVPFIVLILIWKYFYNPLVGPLNKILNATGAMAGLNWLDMRMPVLADAITPLRTQTVGTLFGGVGGLIVFGVMLLTLAGGWRKVPRGWAAWVAIPALAGAAAMLTPLGEVGAFLGGVPVLIAIGIALYYHLGRDARQSGWVWWMILIAGGWLLAGPIRIAGMTAVALAISAVVDKELLESDTRRKAFTAGGLAVVFAGLMWWLDVWGAVAAAGWWGWWPIALGALAAGVGGFWWLLTAHSFIPGDKLKWAGGLLLAVAVLLVLTSMIWTESTDVFEQGKPAWLGEKHLVVPALILWGFPWVGVVGVLLYLSGLGNIDQSVYEASDIDGCGPFRKFWNIELPLIMTQVRLTLVLMIINTLKGWGLIYILLGDGGGPSGAGMVPGLYMFRKAFRDGEAGYASAIGLLLFFLILSLTLFNNKYVRVEK